MDWERTRIAPVPPPRVAKGGELGVGGRGKTEQKIKEARKKTAYAESKRRKTFVTNQKRDWVFGKPCGAKKGPGKYTCASDEEKTNGPQKKK